MGARAKQGPRRAAHAAFIALICAACAAPRSQPLDAPDERSVRPGVNATYLSSELDVERFTRVFEGESREIYASRDEIVADLGLVPGSSVADIGAGTGAFLEPFAAGVGPAGRVYAVDISPKFLAHLRQRVDAEGWAQVEVVEGGERSARLAEGSVDLVFVCDTYHHFEYPRSMLASIHRALRPGGALVVIDFEREPGRSREWILEHVRAGKDAVVDEIEAAGFALERESRIPGLKENYALRFHAVASGDAE